MRCMKISAGRIAGVLVCLSLIYFVLYATDYRRHANLVSRPAFAFVRSDMNRRGAECDKLLFNGTSVDDFTLSADYASMKATFDQIVKSAGFVEGAEGHSGRLLTQTRALHYLASRPSVKTVCETGFNAGHSAFNYLTANRHLVVHSFDIGQYAYTARIAANMSATMFPGRLFFHVGDSTKTVPQFIAANPRVRCDMIVVDGGHSFPVAWSDAVNLASIADFDSSPPVIVLDDYPSPGAQGDAWDKFVKLGYVRETGYCVFKPNGPLAFAPGFAFGTVISKPPKT